MSTHETEWLARLAATQDYEEHEGVSWLHKPIPDQPRKGDLDPRVLAHWSRNEEASPEGPFDLTAARASMGWPNQDKTTRDISTEHITIPSEDGAIPARLYRPNGDEVVPAILFFHGGGFFGGTLDTVENPCKLLAERAHAAVISVDYRLAPEHAFPAGLMDCYRAFEWVHAQASELNLLRDHIAVAGDSAGGNLATACCLLEQERGLQRIRFQALIYPVVNLGSISTDDFRWDETAYDIEHHPSLIRQIVRSLEDTEGIVSQLYVQGKTTLTDPLVSPLFAPDVAAFPPALLVTAEYDYLRLEGEAYARKLARAGVPTRLIQYRGMDHAFMDKLGDYPQAEDCIKEIANALKEMTR